LPEGATPKDGPSAGTAICTAIVSILTGIPVRADVAMTGEITLRGEVLPIGGLKEKLLAAGRGGIRQVLIPEENVKDLVEIGDEIKNRLEIHPVRWIEQVLQYALERQPVPIEDPAAEPAAVPAPVVEYSMAAIVRRVVEFTSQKPREVRFPHAPLGPREDYARWLGVPTRFEAETAGVLFDDAALAAPCHGHDPNLFRFVKAHAELLLQNQSRDSTVRGQVRRLVVGLVAQGEPEVAAVARTLATSERSLQRRLQEEGTSFRDVVDDARKELALGYLGDRRLSVSEVAYLLGYAEAGAFVRAFKRWTGRTPGELRAGV